ncbi:MAG: DUF4126 family protein [Gemmatimonadota bacterium]
MGRRRDDHILLTSAALGAVAGMRSMAAPALLSHEMAEHPLHDVESRLEHLLSSERVAQLLSLFAGGEMLADKAPFVPDRTSSVPLLGRALMGSLTAAAFAVHRRHPVFMPAVVGAASAIASTYGAYHLRRLSHEHLNVPDRLLGLIEDAVVVAMSKAIMESME